MGGTEDVHLFYQGNALLQEGKCDSAAQKYKAALDLYPQFKEAWNNLGVALACLGDTAGAAEAFKQALSLDSSYVEAAANLAQAYEGLGQGDSALVMWRYVLKLDPSNPKALVSLANPEVGFPAEALETFAKRLEEEPENPDNYYFIAVALDRAGKHAEAVDYYIGFLKMSEGKPQYQALRQVAQSRVENIRKALSGN